MADNPAPVRLSARERLLAAASELFYEQGFQNVGIDRVIERAGVAKASLYNTYGSKDELVKAYLESRHARMTARIAAADRAGGDAARGSCSRCSKRRASCSAQPDFNGCAFIGAASGAPRDGTVEHVADAVPGVACARCWRSSQTRPAPRSRPSCARQLHLLYDGAAVTAKMDRDPAAATFSRAAAEALLDAAVAG